MKTPLHRNPAIIFMVLLLALLVLPRMSSADALDDLHWRNPMPTGYDLNAIAYGDGMFVAVGQRGGIYSAPDGITWTINASPVETNLQSIAYGDGRFVAVGENGVIVSSDGEAWTRRPSGTASHLYKVSYGNGWFVAVGDSGVVIRSSDGAIWTPQISGTILSLRGLAFGSSVFVAVSPFSGGTNAYVSADGASWTSHLISFPSYYHSGITYAFGKFYVTSATPSQGGLPFSITFSSTNGVNWTRESLDAAMPRPITSASGQGITVMIAVGGGGARTGFASSTDGVNWLANSVGVNARGIAYGNGAFVSVGSSGQVLRSTNGVDWAQSSGDQGFSLTAGTYADGKYVLIGNTIVTSSDGINFSRFDALGGMQAFAVTRGAGAFVIVGSAGSITRSVDGSNWAPVRSGTKQTLLSIAYGAGRLVAVGSSGAILVSEDAVLWNGVWSGTDYALRSVAYAQGKFVAVGDSGIVLASQDGLTWTPQRNDDLNTLEGVAYGDGRFVAVGNSGTVTTSSDGSTWTKQNSGLTIKLKQVSFGGGLFVAVGDGPVSSVFTSTDGQQWSERSMGGSVTGTAFVSDTFMIFGNNGAIRQSNPVSAVMLSAASNPDTGNFEVAVSGGEIGKTYRLLGCDNLVSPSWAEVTTFVQTQPVTKVVVAPASAAPQRYYRAVAP